MSEPKNTFTWPSLSDQSVDERRSNAERALVRICMSVLHIDSVDLERSFAEHGGDSFSTLGYVAGILREFGDVVTADAVLASGSLGELARTIAGCQFTDHINSTQSELMARLTRLVMPR